MQQKTITITNGQIVLEDGQERREVALYSTEGFSILSNLWLQVGWELRHSYTFTWMGRPIIQMPEDMVRIQELIYSLQPDVIIETGVAHGGSLIFYASLCKMMGKGRVIGVDIEIRPHNRAAIEAHMLSPLITLIEGNSVAPEIIAKVGNYVSPNDTVLVLLDSNHTKEHVLAELRAYSPFVSIGSYIAAADGVMEQLTDVPRGKQEWRWDNPQQAVKEFVAQHPEFILEEPPFLFSESPVQERITYWPNGFVKRIK